MNNTKSFDATMGEFRRNLRAVIIARGLSDKEAAQQLGVTVHYLNGLLSGVKLPGLVRYFQITNWIDSAPAASHPESEPQISVPNEKSVNVLPTFPQSKALLAWMTLQHAFLYMNLPSPSALFRESVETLNAYFSGFDQEEEKKDE